MMTTGGGVGEPDDGTIVLIGDPNDPQAAEFLQQAGLRLMDDGTVQQMNLEGEQPVTSVAELAAAPAVVDTVEQAVAASGIVTAAAATTSAISTAVTSTTVTAAAASPVVAAAASPAAAQSPSTKGIDAKPTNGQQQVFEDAMVSKILYVRCVTPNSCNAYYMPAFQVAAGILPPAEAKQPSPVRSPPAAQPAVAASSTAESPAAAKPWRPLAPDQQEVNYSVTGEDGVTQNFVLLCPKDMDQNVLIETLVKQITSDPATKGGGKKTIRIHQQKSAMNKQQASAAATPTRKAAAAAAASPSKATPVSSRKQNAAPISQKAKRAIAQAQQQQQSAPPPITGGTTATTPSVTAAAAKTATPQSAGQLLVTPGTPITNDLFPSSTTAIMPISKTIMESSELFESVIPDLPIEPADGSTRVYVRCNYCPVFRSSLNGDTWEAILNHILPVAREEIQTTFYGDLVKNFFRCLRIQINGKQVVKGPGGREIPQCEVVLTHSLVCRKTKREFIVSNPDATFVANLAKHIRTTQPGATGRGNSLLCIFCQSPFTYEDYLKHIQPNLDSILATLNCFAGAYCAHFYESTVKAQHMCGSCQEPESPDLRFMPCVKFSSEYACVKKQQFAIDCFREHYSDNGFLRLNTSSVGRCNVCKSGQQTYCAVFQISTTIINDDTAEQQNVDSQLSVCVNCQEQFINIVTKEQGFEEKLKIFQLRNMEQLCSVLRVILNQATPICNDQKTLIYTVHENPSNPNSATHLVKSADITQVNPITKLMALAESEIVGSRTKAAFICDLCLFNVDMTSMVAAPKEKQKNDMLLAIVLEHLVPHTESLMNVIASTAPHQALNLKYEVVSKVQDLTNQQSKIVLSLAKKFRYANTNLEIVVDRDELKTIDNLRMAAKQERKYVRGRQKPGEVPQPDAVINVPAQLAEVNKFIDRHRGKLGVMAQTGCNTTLLNAYTECKLCSKFSFPDFRLTGALTTSSDTAAKNIDLCENCVETVLTLCLPTEPECLTEAEECLALGEARLVGHRLVLSNNLKKWLSLDGVNLIKKTIDDFEEAKLAAGGNVSSVFLQGLKTHLAAVLKTCQKDEDIMHCTAGFCITDAFLNKNNEAQAALASLEKQIGMPIVEKAKTEVQVTILSRRPPGSRKKTITLGGGAGTGTPGRTPVVKRAANGGAGAGSAGVINLGGKKGDQEESISAIQNFINETSKDPAASPPENLKLPAGIKVTNAGKGMVKLRAVSDAPRSAPTAGSRVPLTLSSQKGSTSAASTPTSSKRGAKGVSMVTLTANGVIKKVPEDSAAADNDEGESDDDASSKRKRKSSGAAGAGAAAAAVGSPDKDYKPPTHVAKKVKMASTPTTSGVTQPQPVATSPSKGSGAKSAAATPSSADTSLSSEEQSTTPGARGKRQRKEKKIFDL